MTRSKIFGGATFFVIGWTIGDAVFELITAPQPDWVGVGNEFLHIALIIFLFSFVLSLLDSK